MFLVDAVSERMLGQPEWSRVDDFAPMYFAGCVAGFDDGLELPLAAAQAKPAPTESATTTSSTINLSRAIAASFPSLAVSIAVRRS